MRYIRYILFISLFASSVLLALGQASKYGVSPQVYAIYNDMIEDGITMDDAMKADSLARDAYEHEDYCAQCLFLSIPIRYYGNHDKYELLNQWCDSLRSAANRLSHRKNAWRFWAYHSEVVYLISHLQLFAALDRANLLRDETQNDDDPYGIYISLTTIADIYRMRNDICLAGENYEQALEYQQKYLPEVDPSELYIYLSSYYRRKSGRTNNDMERAKALIESGLQRTKDPTARARLLAEKAMGLYAEKDTQEFNQVYDQCSKLFQENPENPDFLQVVYRKYILDQNYDSAWSVARKLPNEYERSIAQYVILRAQGNYREALLSYERAQHQLNLLREQERRGDLADISANIGKYQLELSQHQLEQQKIKIQSDRDRMAAYVFALSCLIIGVILVGLIMFMRRIKQTNALLEEKNAELIKAGKHSEESDRMKMIFLQNMSHEIRTPLNAIMGFSTLLASPDKKYSEEKCKMFRKLINYNNDLLNTIIDDVLTINDLETGEYVFEYRYTPINEICHLAVESIKSQLKPGVIINFGTTLDDSNSILTDGKRLWQVLNNLLANACKYTRHGVITLEASITKDNYMQLSVSDNGPGIKPHERATIFERSAKLNIHAQDSGLGLNICKKVAELLKGRIYLDTEYGDGARFVFEIPIETELQPAPSV